MNIKDQDVMLVLKLLARGRMNCTFAKLGNELGISASETHQAFHRARRAGFITPLADLPVKSAIAEFLIHGLKYVLPAHPGGRTRGMPTGCAAPPLSSIFGSSTNDPDVLVWPDPEGDSRGFEIRPICRSAPQAAKRDPVLYEWLVLADALRGAGHARERELAENIVRKRLDYAPR